jgi:hypothetical protein
VNGAWGNSSHKTGTPSLQGCFRPGPHRGLRCFWEGHRKVWLLTLPLAPGRMQRSSSAQLRLRPLSLASRGWPQTRRGSWVRGLWVPGNRSSSWDGSQEICEQMRQVVAWGLLLEHTEALIPAQGEGWGFQKAPFAGQGLHGWDKGNTVHTSRAFLWPRKGLGTFTERKEAGGWCVRWDPWVCFWAGQGGY